MSDVLTKICSNTLKELQQRRKSTPLSTLENKLDTAPPVRGFKQNLETTKRDGRFALIAEIKKASPSRGLIRADFDPSKLAQAYQSAGASAISVLTDATYFQGSLDYLAQAHKASSLPCLRKDFMLDVYQVLEARIWGADCILVIMAAVNDRLARELCQMARDLQMDVLVEVHNKEELDRAILLGDDLMLGINNRDLKTLEVDIQTTRQLARSIPLGRLIVSESGISTHKDLEYLSDQGAKAFLVGESLMREDDVFAATKKLLGS